MAANTPKPKKAKPAKKAAPKKKVEAKGKAVERTPKETPPAEKKGRGRPPKYTDVEEFKAKVDQYFKDCEENKTLPGIHGLAVALDMTRETILQYEKTDEFSDTIKKAKEKLRLAWESRLSGPAATGAIFWLKNNAGWRDQQDHKNEVTGKDGGPIQLEWTVRFESVKAK